MNKWKKQFITIYAGQAFSLLGSSAVQFAVIWWLTIQTESAVTLTLASIVAFIPGMILGPFAGVWIDRYNRRTVMIAADGLVALSSVVLGGAFLLSEKPPLSFIYLILLIRGLGNTFHGPPCRLPYPCWCLHQCLLRLVAGAIWSLRSPICLGRCWAQRSWVSYQSPPSC
ncbi:MAG: MFS transporter [Lacrimispora sp.]|nr:MFS transporter [Lacrimispora sp.]MDR7812475.1 MFS transporter [Lacrimispora sp.]